jgi:hypothetical protein
MATLKRYPAITIALFALLSMPFASAGEISMSAEISNASIAFEDKDTLIVNLVWDGEPFLYQIDDFPMPTLEKLEILGSSSSVSTATDSTVSSGVITTRSLRYILQPVDFGTGIISPLNLSAKNRVTEEVSDLQTGRLTVEIAKPVPRKEPQSGKTVIYIIVVVVVVAAAGIAIVILVKGKRAGEKETPVDLSYLDALKDIKKETISDRKLFYSRLYRLLLAYLEKERALEVTGKTGQEVIDILGQLDDDAEKANLMRWINLAQAVKYRPEAPSAGDVENTYIAVCKFFEDKLSNR